MVAAADPVSATFLVGRWGHDGFELGQTASVKLLAAVNNRDGVRVPLPAVAERGGKSVVWVLDAQTYNRSASAGRDWRHRGRWCYDQAPSLARKSWWRSSMFLNPGQCAAISSPRTPQVLKVEGTGT